MADLLDKLPVKLKQDTIFEAVFEVRFKPSRENVADLLPGILYKDLANDFPKTESLPGASFIRTQVKLDPILKYKPTHRMIGEKYVLLIGDDVISLSSITPYQGWKNFKEEILRIVSLLKGTSLVTEIERFSIKYVNLISDEINNNLFETIKLKTELGPFLVSEVGFNLRLEIKLNDFLNIVTISPQTIGSKVDRSHTVKGLLLDIDTISNFNIGADWSVVTDKLESAHDTEKAIYFNSISEQTLEKLGPIWKN